MDSNKRTPTALAFCLIGNTSTDRMPVSLHNRGSTRRSVLVSWQSRTSPVTRQSSVRLLPACKRAPTSGAAPVEARQHTASSVLSAIAAPVAAVPSLACSQIALNRSVLCSTFPRGVSGELVILELSGKEKLDILTPSR